ncbi:hypothetical protein Trydic_g7713 [Trypoxylus dichotomus]
MTVYIEYNHNCSRRFGLPSSTIKLISLIRSARHPVETRRVTSYRPSLVDVCFFTHGKALTLVGARTRTVTSVATLNRRCLVVENDLVTPSTECAAFKFSYADSNIEMA